MEVYVAVSVGELVDKITILRIKKQRILDQKKNKNICAELELLLLSAQKLGIDPDSPLSHELKRVNESLWEVEDKLRDKERLKSFDNEFIELARSVYRINDQRFALKSQINKTYGSELHEEKSYKPY